MDGRTIMFHATFVTLSEQDMTSINFSSLVAGTRMNVGSMFRWPQLEHAALAEERGLWMFQMSVSEARRRGPSTLKFKVCGSMLLSCSFGKHSSDLARYHCSTCLNLTSTKSSRQAFLQEGAVLEPAKLGLCGAPGLHREPQEMFGSRSLSL